MKLHPYGVSPLTDRPPFSSGGPARVGGHSSWELVAAAVGGILLGLLGLFAV